MRLLPISFFDKETSTGQKKRTIKPLLLAISLILPSTSFACVMDGLGSGALTHVPSKTFSVQAAMYQAINANFISASQGGNYNQKLSMLLYQMQMKLNKKDLTQQENTEFYVFESSKGHYFKVMFKEGKASVLLHEIPTGTNINDTIVSDIDALIEIVKGSLNVPSAVKLGVLHIPEAQTAITAFI
ncbi:hypothetical protein C9J48_08790 [Photobacterium profundum]|uniref:Uncharacterized protein n=1 Tax=Photobacterium profundum 3TCK TaxID=314280 RepID=Q1ZB76_9GAMM|nr:hypothetical protein [Photobacterium profundum]EAS45266.1 hypothetical protein P3TCK_02796 [Photobacterium profundum 3TCK]PSV63534.1 hypothetical protein C9J48_08790 [Photobacterium profundum]